MEETGDTAGEVKPLDEYGKFEVSRNLHLGFSSCFNLLALTVDTFSDKCFSKNLGSLWEDIDKAIEGEDEIEIGQVDCSVSKPFCSKVDIHSYPTFKLFYNDEEDAKYQGTRDVESVQAFAIEEVGKAAAKALKDDDKICDLT